MSPLGWLHTALDVRQQIAMHASHFQPQLAPAWVGWIYAHHVEQKWAGMKGLNFEVHLLRKLATPGSDHKRELKWRWNIHWIVYVVDCWKFL